MIKNYLLYVDFNGKLIAKKKEGNYENRFDVITEVLMVDVVRGVEILNFYLLALQRYNFDLIIFSTIF